MVLRYNWPRTAFDKAWRRRVDDKEWDEESDEVWRGRDRSGRYGRRLSEAVGDDI
jgi:hypothetical protein